MTLEKHRPAPLLVVPLLLGLAGCAASIAEQGMADVARMTEGPVGTPVVWIRTDEEAAKARERTTELLARPLAAEAAVEIALLNNRALQASLASLGIGAADLARARLPDAPGLSFSRKTRGDELEIERAITLNILGILTLPIRAGMEERNFEQTKLATAQDVLALAAQTRRAYFEAVAAFQAAEIVTKAVDVASARAEIAKRLAEGGNWSPLNYIREQSFYAEAAVMRTRARLNATVAREKLARSMGLYGNDLAFRLPDRLPDLPLEAADIADAETRAVTERLDIQMARSRIDRLASSLGLTKATRFVDVIELGLSSARETGNERQSGYEIHIEVPIFDFGESKVARAEAIYLQAVNRLGETAINARSDVRVAHARYRSSFDVSRQYRKEILPMRQRISEEMVYRYNGMLASVFELLADSRDELNIVMAAVEAERDFWLADTDLNFALRADVGAGSGGGSRATAGPSAPAGH